MSRADLLRILALPLGLLGLFCFVHLAGWRPATAVISGSSPPAGLSHVQGVLYLVAWFGLVVGAPIALLRGLIGWRLERWALGRQETTPPANP